MSVGAQHDADILFRGITDHYLKPLRAYRQPLLGETQGEWIYYVVKLLTK